MTDIPAGAHALLALIRKSETGRTDPQSYDTLVFNKDKKLTKRITDYTLDELLEAQKAWSKNWGGSAAGAYQIIRATLAGLLPIVGIPGSSRFIPSVQDQFGFALLERRGYESYVAGKITGQEFARRLAMEWASWPVLAPAQGRTKKVTRGQSYYAGDGVNGATITPEQVENALLIAKMTPQKPVAPKEPVTAPATPSKPVSPPQPAPKPKFTLLGWLMKLFGRRA